jgi:multidrug efflux pump subunit AcrA (membrane-fusion protein)
MDDDQVVFVAASDTRFEKRVIKTGLEQHGHVQVVDGLKEGDRIVTTGSFILKSELLKGELGEE